VHDLKLRTKLIWVCRLELCCDHMHSAEFFIKIVKLDLNFLLLLIISFLKIDFVDANNLCTLHVFLQAILLENKALRLPILSFANFDSKLLFLNTTNKFKAVFTLFKVIHCQKFIGAIRIFAINKLDLFKTIISDYIVKLSNQ